jgi:hypothetical protein
MINTFKIAIAPAQYALFPKTLTFSSEKRAAAVIRRAFWKEGPLRETKETNVCFYNTAGIRLAQITKV